MSVFYINPKDKNIFFHGCIYPVFLITFIQKPDAQHKLMAIAIELTAATIESVGISEIQPVIERVSHHAKIRKIVAV